jgi:PAS domain S-box-containing protein
MSPEPDLLANPRRVLELVPAIVIVTDPDGGLLYLSSMAGEYFGLEPGVPLVSWLSTIDPVDQDRASDQWALRGADVSTWTSEFRMRRADGEYRRMVVTARAARESADELIGWVCTCDDVEDERSLSEALRHSAVELGTLLVAAEGASARERIRLTKVISTVVVAPLEEATRELTAAIASLRNLLEEAT